MKIALALALLAQITAQDGWVEYSVPIAEGRRIWCSGVDESSSELRVQYEVTDRAITAVRVSSPQCADKKAARFLGAVDPQESIRLLSDLVEHEPSVARKATDALALHEGTGELLVRIARTNPASKVRSAALFWVGHLAGQKAASVLRDAIDNDPDDEVRAKAVFAVAQLPDDRSIPLLIELMTTHRRAAVRKKAAFWLGQKDDPRALEALERVLLK